MFMTMKVSLGVVNVWVAVLIIVSYLTSQGFQKMSRLLTVPSKAGIQLNLPNKVVVQLAVRAVCENKSFDEVVESILADYIESNMGNAIPK